MNALRESFYRVFWLSILLPLANMHAQNTGLWREMNIPVDEDRRFRLIHFGDSLSGWIFAEKGKFTRTTDGGKSWSEAKAFPSTKRVVAARLFDSHNGIVAVALSEGFPRLLSVFRTNDFGDSWSESILPDSIFVDGAFSALNQDIIGFISNSHYLYLSSDLGDNWSRTMYSSHLKPTLLEILNEQTYFAGGGMGTLGSGFLALTTDGGTTWQPFGPQENLVFVSSHFYNHEMGYFWMDYGDEPVERTTILFNERSFVRQSYEGASLIGAIYEDSTECTFPSRSALKIHDDDSTYFIQSHDATGLKILRLATIDRSHSWILADSNRAFRRVDKLTDIRDISSLVNEEDNREEIVVFPNPANSGCSIRLTSHVRTEFVRILIYDVLGRLIRALYEADLESGVTEVVWDGKNDQSMDVASGAYRVVLSSTMRHTSAAFVYLK